MADDKTLSYHWIDLCACDEVSHYGFIALKADGHDLLLSSFGSELHCFQNACTHLGYPLDMGHLQGDTITCPFHQYRFSLRDGRCINRPCNGLREYPVNVEAGRVRVQIRSENRPEESTA